MSEKQKVSTYCYQCVNGPDMLSVEVVDGVATTVTPNFDAKGFHPADGKVCVKPYGLVQKIYNPNRILKPMKRTNPKKGRNEDPRWVEIEWEEALDTVAARLNAIRQTNLLDEQGYPRFAFTTGGAATPYFYMGSFVCYMAAWGPVDQSLGAGGTVKCYHTEHVYGELWHRAFTVCPDTPRCNYIISFGNNIDASGGVTSVRRHADARDRGIKRIQVEPHLSITGASASEWVPIRPKTDPAFLYAMLNVLLHEHTLSDLDVPFLKARTGSPYLVAPNGFFLRDTDSKKPLIWDADSNTAVAFDTPGANPALLGSFTASGCEVGADGKSWEHRNISVSTAFEKARELVARHTPEWAAPITDVAAATIRRIANEFLEHARIGETIEFEGRTLPFRPVAVMLGKSVNNGWGAFECVWARTMMMILVGGLEVPGGLLGSTVHITGMDFDRMGSVVPHPDGFLDYPFNPTDKENWIEKPQVRHGHTTLIPIIGGGLTSQLMGSTVLSWMRLQGRAAESWGTPKPPDVWFVYRCNPNISFSETEKLGETMTTFPFTVAIAYTEDETNHFADIILPEAIDLESTQLIRIGGTHYFEQFWETQGWVLRQPVVKPQGDARDFTWISTELAKRTGLLETYNQMINGGVLGLPLKTDSYDFSLDPAKAHSVDQIWDAVCRAASIDVTEGKSSEGLDYFKEKGFRVKPFSKLNWYLYPRMEDLNLRFELPYQERILRIGQELGARLHEHGVTWWDKQLHEYEALPEWKDLTELWSTAYEKAYGIKAKDYPFWLLTSRSMQYAWGGNVSLQMIREVAANVTGHDGIMINADVAARLGIEQGDRIEVTSPIGFTRGRALVRQGVRPDTVVMVGQFGHWKTPYAKGFDTPSLNSLVPMNMDLVDGTGSAVDAVLVNIKKVER